MCDEELQKYTHGCVATDQHPDQQCSKLEDEQCVAAPADRTKCTTPKRGLGWHEEASMPEPKLASVHEEVGSRHVGAARLAQAVQTHWQLLPIFTPAVCHQRPCKS